jgi:hypothetical protein
VRDERGSRVAGRVEPEPLLLMAFGVFPAFASGVFFTFMAIALAREAFSFILVLDTLIWREFK